MPKFTRKQILAGAAPLVAAAPFARLSLPGHEHSHLSATHEGHNHPALGHAAMIRDHVPASGGPHDLDKLLYPPKALPHKPGRVREYELVAVDKTIEVAPGVEFNAWTYNGTVPGPVIRATEDDLLRVKFHNGGSHPHTIHFHGIHQAKMDGVFEVVLPGDSFTYEFTARPAGMHLYHCHATPLKKHIHKGLYGSLIIDPRSRARPRRSS